MVRIERIEVLLDKMSVRSFGGSFYGDFRKFGGCSGAVRLRRHLDGDVDVERDGGDEREHRRHYKRDQGQPHAPALRTGCGVERARADSGHRDDHDHEQSDVFDDDEYDDIVFVASLGVVVFKVEFDGDGDDHDQSLYRHEDAKYRVVCAWVFVAKSGNDVADHRRGRSDYDSKTSYVLEEEEERKQ